MTISPGPLSVVPLNEPDENPTNPPAYVSARALGANSAETITVPAGARFVRLAGNADFYVAYGAGVTAVVPVDTDDGSSNELIKNNGGGAVWRSVQGLTALSVISAASASIVTASFYT